MYEIYTDTVGLEGRSFFEQFDGWYTNHLRRDPAKAVTKDVCDWIRTTEQKEAFAKDVKEFNAFVGVLNDIFEYAIQPYTSARAFREGMGYPEPKRAQQEITGKTLANKASTAENQNAEKNGAKAAQRLNVFIERHIQDLPQELLLENHSDPSRVIDFDKGFIRKNDLCL